MKIRWYLVIMAISLVAVFFGACPGQEPISPKPAPAPQPTTPPTQINEVTEEESQQIALDFLMNDPTFKFDGIAETVKLAETLTAQCPYCWTFVFEFESRYAGYGDRTGQILAQVITPHRAVINVEQGNITYAVMDDAWDMMKQQILTPPKIETDKDRE